MRVIFSILIQFSFFFALAGEHREHEAHEHGAGKLGIAFDGSNGKMDLKIPSESIVGFEHKAKSKADKTRTAKALALLTEQISKMVVFESELKCVMTSVSAETVQQPKSSHNDTVAVFNIICAKSPIGSEIVFNFQTYFPKIRDLDVEIIADNVQKSVEVRKINTRLLLK